MCMTLLKYSKKACPACPASSPGACVLKLFLLLPMTDWYPRVGDSGLSSELSSPRSPAFGTV